MLRSDDTGRQSQSLTLVLVDPNGNDEHYAIVPFPDTYHNAMAAAIRTLGNYMDGNEAYVILRRSIKNRKGEWVWADIPPEHWKTMVKRRSTEVGVFARPRYAPGPFLHGPVHFTYGRDSGDGIAWQSISDRTPQIHSQKAMARPKSFAEAVTAARAKLAVFGDPCRCVLIPLPLFFAQTIYGVRGLEAWVVIGIIWVFCSCLTVVVYPLWESREALGMVCRGMLKDVFGGGAGKYVEPVARGEKKMDQDQA